MILFVIVVKDKNARMETKWKDMYLFGKTELTNGNIVDKIKKKKLDWIEIIEGRCVYDIV